MDGLHRGGAAVKDTYLIEVHLFFVSESGQQIVTNPVITPSPVEMEIAFPIIAIQQEDVSSPHTGVG